jgi:hypothetical protein
MNAGKSKLDMREEVIAIRVVSTIRVVLGLLISHS